MEELRLQQLEERKEESLELLKQQIARDRAEEKELAEGNFCSYIIYIFNCFNLLSRFIVYQ